MNKYIKYLLYVLEHKKNVFKTCWSKGLYLHSFTHDLSKFRPSEFIPYARYFYGNYPPNALLKDIGYKNIKTKEKIKEDFDKAWELHYKRNKHHPEHWVSKDIPRKYIKQMVCDLEAMSLKFGGTAQEYYLKNYNKWNITHETRLRLERELDLINKYNGAVSECSPEVYMTIEELIENMEDHYNTYGSIADETPENCLNNFLKYACNKYSINIYRLVKGE